MCLREAQDSGQAVLNATVDGADEDGSSKASKPVARGTKHATGSWQANKPRTTKDAKDKADAKKKAKAEVVKKKAKAK